MRRVTKFWYLLSVLLVVAAGITAVWIFRAELAHASAPTSGALYTCSPDLVVSANVRVVAHCASGYYIDPSTTIYWFAYPTKDSANASRMLSLFETAKATASTVTFYFDTADESGGAYGCAITDCRAIWAATTP